MQDTSFISPCEKRTWWALMLLLFLAPLPLGSNRPWAWGLLSVLSLLIAGSYALFCGRAMREVLAPHRGLVALMVAWSLLPVLQLIPLPLDVLEWISPGSAAVWSVESARIFAPISIAPYMTFDVGLRQAAALVMGIVLLTLLRHSSFRVHLMWLMVSIGLFNATIGLINFTADNVLLFFEPATKGDSATVFGTFVNKNHFAGLMEVTFPFAIMLLVERVSGLTRNNARPLREFSVWCLLFVVFVFFAAYLLSASRAGVVAGIVSGALVLFGQSRRNATSFWVAVSTALIALFVLFLVFHFAFGMDRLWHVYSQRMFDDARLVHWQDVLDGIQPYWIAGGGTGAYDAMFGAMKSSSLGGGRFDHAHNDYIELLATQGLIGLLIVTSILVSVYVGLRAKFHGHGRRAERYQLLAGTWSVLAVLIHYVFDFNMQIPSNFLLFVVLLMLLSAGKKTPRIGSGK